MSYNHHARVSQVIGHLTASSGSVSENVGAKFQTAPQELMEVKGENNTIRDQHQHNKCIHTYMGARRMNQLEVGHSPIDVLDSYSSPIRVVSESGRRFPISPLQFYSTPLVNARGAQMPHTST